jgi:hypothetical protein
MRRATRFGALILCVLASVLVVPAARAQRVDLVNAIGLVDYTRAPRFKVGDWVKYRVTGTSEAGMEDDYVATILIGGEERFWGEECFWIETWTAPKGGVESAVATLMSYSAFGDTAWLENFQKYARKTVSDVDEDGRPIIQIMKRSGSYKRRGGPRRSITYAIDSLGTDTVTAVKGVIYKCAKVSIRQGIGMNSDVGDSTVRNEVREDRMAYYSDKVPITSLAREDIETSTIRKSWKIGRSADAIQKTVDHGLGISRIVDYGSGGLAPKLVPISARKPLARQGAKSPTSTRSATAR